MVKTTLTRKELADRWGVNERTIINYEQDGVIKAMRLPKPLYSLSMILEIEGTDLDTLTPIEKRRLERENEDLKKQLLDARQVIKSITSQCLKVVDL